MLRPDLQFILIALSSSTKTAPSIFKSLDFTWDMALFTGPLDSGARGADLQKMKEAQVYRLPQN